MRPHKKEHRILQFIIIGCFAALPQFVYSSYNIALGKPATQSTVYSGWGADKAVDGVIGKDVAGGSCSSTKPTGSRDAWWRVDLQQMSRIKTLNVTYRQLFPFRLSGFYLYVSNTSAVDNLPSTGHLCYHDNITDPDLLPTFNQSRPCTVDGRYVIFYNKRPADNGPKSHRYYSTTDAVVELCEVQVYGCPVNRFGPNCRTICHCGVGGCDPDTGICDVTGCQSGWKGPSCSSECGLGTFGIDCNHTCHCLNPGCDRETGSCRVPGCEAGWKGLACDSEAVNSKECKPTDAVSIGFAVLGTLLFISICFNIGLIIDRMRTRTNSKSKQFDNEMQNQNSMNGNDNYDDLEASKVGQGKNIYDTIAK